MLLHTVVVKSADSIINTKKDFLAVYITYIITNYYL